MAGGGWPGAVSRARAHAHIRLALTMLVSRIRGVIKQRTDSAVDGVLRITPEELHADALYVACTLGEFPFSVDEKCALIEKAWEIVGP